MFGARVVVSAADVERFLQARSRLVPVFLLDVALTEREQPIAGVQRGAGFARGGKRFRVVVGRRVRITCLCIQPAEVAEGLAFGGACACLSGEGQRFLIAGAGLKIISNLLNIPAAAIAPWLVQAGRSVPDAASMLSGYGIFCNVVGMAGIICLVYAFWVKFKERNLEGEVLNQD